MDHPWMAPRLWRREKVGIRKMDRLTDRWFDINRVNFREKNALLMTVKKAYL